LERDLLDLLFHTGRRLPDAAQHEMPDLYAVADFFYHRPGDSDACVFVDGSVHDQPQQKAQDAVKRGELKAAGYRVVVIRYDQDLEQQVAGHEDVFGPGNGKSAP
jgi:very-short-patch-repair endonuclease